METFIVMALQITQIDFNSSQSEIDKHGYENEIRAREGGERSCKEVG